MADHSKFGPSGAHRWLNCPGSVKAEGGILEPPVSEFAYEGTCAHELAELCLTKKTDTNIWIGKKLLYNKEWLILPEMADYIQMYVDYVRTLDGFREIEQHISYEEWVPEGYGTADVIITNKDTIYVIDLKYGKGVKIDAEENPQGMLYALGALDERSAFQIFKKVIIVIHQPRLDHVSTWEITPDKLYEWADWVKGRVGLCLEDNAKRIPGEKQCQWCKAKPTCPALQETTETAVMAKFNDMNATTIKPANDLTDDQITFIMTNKKLIEAWLKSVEAHVRAKIETGGNFPGWKLVNGCSTRKWNDEEKAERLLRRLLGARNAYKKTLLTPPAAEKVLGKEKKHRIDKLIVKPEGAPVLVPEDDKRQTIKQITAEDF